MTRTLTEFKRPSQDNCRGAGSLAASGWNGGDQGLDYWIAELQALDLKWLLVLDSNADSIPLCRKLVAAGIFPVVRILRQDPPPNDSPEPNPGHLNAAEEETVRKLVGEGVLYFETNSEPDLARQWKNGAIPADTEEAAKLVALNWLFDARFILEAGGYPGLPAISSGAAMDLIGALVSLGRQDILLDGCWLALHNYPLNRPLNFPADNTNQIGAPLPPDQYDLGPLTKWVWWNLKLGRADTLDDLNQTRASGKRVDSTIFQDHACFREYEFYAALLQKYLGRPIPIISTEGGFSIGRRDDPRYPRITPQMQAEFTVALFDRMQRDAPDYYFACMPSWLIPSAGLQAQSWYSDFWQRTFQNGPRANSGLPPFAVPALNLGAPLPVVAAVKTMPNLKRGSRLQAPPPPITILAKPPPPPPPPNEESIYLTRQGDTLAQIAEKFGTTIASLMSLNRISDPNRLVLGQRIIIPPASRAPGGLVPGSRQASTTVQVPPPRSPPLPPKPRGWDQFDSRLATLNVRVLNAMVPAGYPFWRLIRAEYQDPTQSSGHHYVSYLVMDENGAPVAGQRVFEGLGDERSETRTDPSGAAKIPITTSYSPEQGESGPYAAWVDGLPSDRVTGLGLPVNRQVNFRLIWQKTIR